MSTFHWHLIFAMEQVLFAIALVGSVSAGFYYRYLYEAISERMNIGCRMLKLGRTNEDVLEVMLKH